MAKDSNRRRDSFDVGETGGAFSGFLADEDEFDRRTYWRLGSWAAVALGAVAVAFFTNQSSIGWRREQTASADLIRQSQQIRLAARDSLSEARRLSSTIDTLNSDRDRLYSRVAVLEQGLDSVTGSIARQVPATPQAAAASKATSIPANSNQTNASAASIAGPSAPSQPPASVSAAVAAPAASSSTSAAQADLSPAPNSSPAPAIAPVAATTPTAIEKTAPEKVAAEKQEKQAARLPVSSESSSSSVVALSSQQALPATASVQPSGSLMSSNSMMGPPDKTASKLTEPASPPKTFSAAPLSAPLQDINVADANASETPEPEPLPAPALVVRRTEFGVDIGGANSMQGLRALWRGLLKSRNNVALTTLRPMIVIKENNSGMGMQLRLVAGPISDAAAAAKICASLTVSDRSCTTTVFEGQRLVMGDEKPDTKSASEARASTEAKPEADAKPVPQPRTSGRRHYAPRHSARTEEPPPPSASAAPAKQEASTFSAIFGSR